MVSDILFNLMIFFPQLLCFIDSFRSDDLFETFSQLLRHFHMYVYPSSRLCKCLEDFVAYYFRIMKVQPYGKPLKQHIFDLKTENENAHKAKNRLHEQLTKLQTKCRDNDNKIEKLEKDNARLKQFQDIVAEHPKLESAAAIAMMEHDFEELKKKFSLLQIEKEKVNRDFEMHKTENFKLRKMVEDLKDEMRTTKKQLREASENLEGLNASLGKSVSSGEAPGKAGAAVSASQLSRGPYIVPKPKKLKRRRKVKQT